MEYTDVIIRRLRDRLMRYRTENRIGGRKRPWHRVAQDIADAESVPQSFYNREDNFDVLGEALRRFEAGLQVPSKERLDAIRAFLIEKRYLDADSGAEDEDDPRRLCIDINTYLMQAGAKNFASDQKIEGTYIAMQQNGGRYDYRTLSLTQAGSNVWSVEDMTFKTSMPARTNKFTELTRFLKVASTITMRRDGYAVAAPNGQMMALSKDRLTHARSLTPIHLQHPTEGAAEMSMVVLGLDAESSGSAGHEKVQNPSEAFAGCWMFVKQVAG